MKCAGAESLFAESTDERLYDIRTRALKLWCDLIFCCFLFLEKDVNFAFDAVWTRSWTGERNHLEPRVGFLCLECVAVVFPIA